MDQVVCSVCGLTRSIFDFYAGDNYANRNTCKPCVKARNKDRLRDRRNTYGSHAWSYEKWRKLRARALRKNLPFDLTVHDVSNLYSIKTCGYCLRQGQVMSFDRMIPEDGYTISNAFMACFECNAFRGDKFTHSEMRLIATSLIEVYKKRERGRLQKG